MRAGARDHDGRAVAGLIVRNVLILDTETQGIEPAEHAVIEVGAILYSLEHATALESFSSLIRADKNPAEAVNRIPAAALVDAPPADCVWPLVRDMVERADAFLAHKAEFDRAFVPDPIASLRPWVCTHEDWPWPNGSGTLVNVLIVVGSCWYRAAQWNECRAAGLSRFYCLQHTF